MNINDHYAIFLPCLLIIHEIWAHGSNANDDPFSSDDAFITTSVPWQDWIEEGGVFDPIRNSFIRAPNHTKVINIFDYSYYYFIYHNHPVTALGNLS